MKSNDLRELADYLDAHPESPLNNLDGEISSYGTTSEHVARLISEGAAIDLLQCNESIIYVTQKFGDVTVRHIVNKKKICTPSVVNGEVVWGLNPELTHVAA